MAKTLPRFLYSPPFPLILIGAFATCLIFINLLLLGAFLIFIAVACGTAIIIHQRGGQKIPLIIPALLVISMTALLLIPTGYLAILIGLSLILIGYFSRKNGKITKKTAFLFFCGAFFAFVIGISLLPRTPEPATFTSSRTGYEISFDLFKQRKGEDYTSIAYSGFKSDTPIFKCLIFVGIRTDKNISTDIPNYGAAWLRFQFNLTKTIPGTTIPFFNTSIQARLINWDEFVKEMLDMNRPTGYELYDKMKELAPYSNYYNETESSNSVSMETTQLRMTTYLLALNMVIKPTPENKDLYEVWPASSFDANISFFVESGLNYGYLTDVPGYAWVIRGFMPSPEAGNFFEDLIGESTISLIVLFIISFFFGLLVALLQKSAEMITVINILLVCIFFIGLFAGVADAMNDVPWWISAIFWGSTGQYVWAVFTAVKYLIMVGAVMGLLLIVGNYVSSALRMIFMSIPKIA